MVERRLPRLCEPWLYVGGEFKKLIQRPVSHGLVFFAGGEAKSIGIKKQPMKAVFYFAD